MTEESSNRQQANVRLSKPMRRSTAVAIGSTVTVGLTVYLLLGPIYSDAGTETPTYYLLTLFFFLPLVLALAERASVTPGQGGLFNLSRGAGSVALAFSTGWILVGGLIGLAGLFAWEGGLALSQIVNLFFEIELEGRWLSVILILLLLFRNMSEVSDSWKRRKTIVYAAVLMLVIVLFAARFGSTELPDTWVYIPSSNLFTKIPFLAVSLWSLHLVLDRRDEIRRPRRRMLSALLFPIILGGILGALIALALLHYPSLTYAQDFPLLSLAQELQPLSAFLAMMAMFGLGILGANESLSSSMKLTAALSDDGFLPQRLTFRERVWQRPSYPLLIIVLLAILAVLFRSMTELVILSASTIVLAVVLVNTQDLFRFHPRLAENRWPRLPFHPLVPGLAVALGITLLISQPWSNLLVVGPWLLAGMFVYIAYARQGAITVRQREALVSGTVLPAEKKRYRVMVALADPAKAPALIRLGTQIAAAHNGLLLVLQVSAVADNGLASKANAQEAWQALSYQIRPFAESRVPITPLVRLASSASEGILATIWEEKIDLVLLGWPAARAPGIGDRDGTISLIVRKAQCEVVILNGKWTGATHKILVPVVSAGHSPAALSLGQYLMSEEQDGAEITALRVLSGRLTDKKKDEAERQLQRTLADLEDRSGIEGQVIAALNTKEGILQIADQYDVLLLGLSKEGFLAQTDFSGLPVDVAEESSLPTLLVKRGEKTAQYWLRRSWDEVSDVLPKLSPKRQAIVRSEMRHDAKADIDFYVLMVLAASIALFGLLQDSAAVIIGAMLVAPLMSPILAMAHSIVRGQLKMLREAAESAVNGIVLAITVAALLSLFLLAIGIPLHPTDEILARTQPNFLDLLVALASGAAAAYAISRSEVGAALPGVAIAAALVPPLAVVGYGLGTAQFDSALGAMFLFLTNLAAIVLAAAIVFLLLGFRPPTRTDRDEQARFGLKMAVIGLVLIAVPLLITSRASATQSEKETTIATILESNWPPSQAQVVDIEVSQKLFDDLQVTCTIFDYSGVVTDEAIAKLQVEISHAAGKPVTLGARTINARLMQFDDSSAARLLTATPTATTTPESTPSAQDGATGELAAPASQTPPPTETRVPAVSPTWTPMMDITPGPNLTATIESPTAGTTTPAPADTIEPEATVTWTPAPFDTAEPAPTETGSPVATDTIQPGATATSTPPPSPTSAP
ncbi:MAG: DUF389 domain-containing protein [Chloroflexi bacterium]|jgi:uncharacterized hydrophobic protein (TIGR00271 family)|nr:DUF389 domain-containing protein [Chloroflexota bacterium]